jgi:hypothetical protein
MEFMPVPSQDHNLIASQRISAKSLRRTGVLRIRKRRPSSATSTASFGMKPFLGCGSCSERGHPAMDASACT